jgi:hypothetical protein
MANGECHTVCISFITFNKPVGKYGFILNLIFHLALETNPKEIVSINGIKKIRIFKVFFIHLKGFNQRLHVFNFFAEMLPIFTS